MNKIDIRELIPQAIPLPKRTPMILCSKTSNMHWKHRFSGSSPMHTSSIFADFDLETKQFKTKTPITLYCQLCSKIVYIDTRLGPRYFIAAAPIEAPRTLRTVEGSIHNGLLAFEANVETYWKLYEMEIKIYV